MGGGLGVLLAAAFLPPLIHRMTPGTLPLSDLVHLDRARLFANHCCEDQTEVDWAISLARRTAGFQSNERLSSQQRDAVRW
jgi:hypothetical protein